MNTLQSILLLLWVAGGSWLLGNLLGYERGHEDGFELSEEIHQLAQKVKELERKREEGRMNKENTVTIRVWFSETKETDRAESLKAYLKTVDEQLEEHPDGFKSFEISDEIGFLKLDWEIEVVTE